MNVIHDQLGGFCNCINIEICFWTPAPVKVSYEFSSVCRFFRDYFFSEVTKPDFFLEKLTGQDRRVLEVPNMTQK